MRDSQRRRWVNAAWALAVAVVVAAYLWAPWPDDWITTALLVSAIVGLFVMERLA